MKRLPAFLLFVFITQSVFADITCDTDINDYNAVYEVNSYTCSYGRFLPANAVACVACSSGFTCPGGTFSFNENYFQGLSFYYVPDTSANNVCAANFPSDLVARYEPNSHTCSPGYYLPANVDACTICPAGSICSGGTYSFNEMNNQGIETANCANGYSAPAGSAACVGNTINVRWGDSNGNVYETTTCTFGGALNTPLTEPTPPRGHHFTGWSFPIPTYDFSTLDADTDGSGFTDNASTMTWTANFSYGDVSGVALCSVTPGSWLTAGTPDTSTTGETRYCWCKATGYTPTGSNTTYQNSSTSAWVYRADDGTASFCPSICAYDCGYFVRYRADFRQALFGIQ